MCVFVCGHVALDLSGFHFLTVNIQLDVRLQSGAEYIKTQADTQKAYVYHLVKTASHNRITVGWRSIVISYKHTNLFWSDEKKPKPDHRIGLS